MIRLTPSEVVSALRGYGFRVTGEWLERILMVRRTEQGYRVASIDADGRIDGVDASDYLPMIRGIVATEQARTASNAAA